MIMLDKSHFLLPEWPAPANIRSLVSTRAGGGSEKNYHSLNLSTVTGDEPEIVAANRAAVANLWQWPSDQLCWIKQVHGQSVVEADLANNQKEADAVFTYSRNKPCLVSTADCLPVLLCDAEGSFAAAIHAGWKGLLAGVIENAIDTYSGKKENLMAWLGPAISQAHFEVGPEVRAEFLAEMPFVERFFIAGKQDRWHASLRDIAELLLNRKGINQVYGGHWCTYALRDMFYSYRRDGAESGRFISAVWLM